MNACICRVANLGGDMAYLRGGSAEIPQGRLLRWQMSDSLGLPERPFTPFS
jgi:hypothetical protein